MSFAIETGKYTTFGDRRPTARTLTFTADELEVMLEGMQCRAIMRGCGAIADTPMDRDRHDGVEARVEVALWGPRP